MLQPLAELARRLLPSARVVVNPALAPRLPKEETDVPWLRVLVLMLQAFFPLAFLIMAVVTVVLVLGIREGMEFIIYRQNNYIVKVRAERVPDPGLLRGQAVELVGGTRHVLSDAAEQDRPDVAPMTGHQHTHAQSSSPVGPASRPGPRRGAHPR